jgi:hypothetical protein
LLYVFRKGKISFDQIKYLLALVIWGIESHVYPQAALDHDSPIFAPCVAGVTGMLHRT